MDRMIIGWDTETSLLTATDKAPPLVCLTLAGGSDSLEAMREHLARHPSHSVLFQETGDTWTALVRRTHALDAFSHALLLVALNGGRMVAHNLAFDWGVMVRAFPELLELSFASYVGQWVSDTRIREQLLCIATDNFVYDDRLGRSRGANEGGGFSLAELVEIYYQVDIAGSKVKLSSLIKEGVPKSRWPWRYRYEELRDTRLEDWHPKAKAYAIEDAVWARRVYIAQATPQTLPEGVLVSDEGDVTDEAAQVANDWALHLIQVNGAPVDPDAVNAFTAKVEKEARLSQDAARSGGFRVINKCRDCEGTGKVGTVPRLTTCLTCAGEPGYLPERCRTPLAKEKMHLARLREWVTWGYGGEPPRKDPTEAMRKKGVTEGNVQYDADTCARSQAPILKEYAKGLAAEKLRNTYVPLLQAGARDGSIHARFNVLVRSGRTSSARPNMQNPPRKYGFRECFKAPAGQVFCSLDYKAHELATLAQVCHNLFGHSVLADHINAGEDCHVIFAVNSLLPTKGIHITHDECLEVLKDAKGLPPDVYEEARTSRDHPLHIAVNAAYYRQVAKVCDFGYPGGLGASTFVDYARGYNLALSPAESEAYKEYFLRQWPMVARYLEWISDKSTGWGEGDRFTLVQHHSGRIRGGCSFTSGANTLFQGLAADGIKAANFEIARRQHADPSSALYGTRTWNLIHDELLLVGPESAAHEWAHEASAIMVEVMQRYTPNVKQEALPALSRRWYKDADTVYDSNNRLAVWTPKD